MTDWPAALIIEKLHGEGLSDPFGVFGMHDENGSLIVRAFLPWASAVSVVDLADGSSAFPLDRVDDAGLYIGKITDRSPFPYRFRVTTGHGEFEIEDPYRFGPVLGEQDIYYLTEGTHIRSFEKLGAHSLTIDGVDGVGFAVWAPSARSVSVVGSFNDWDGRRHAMRSRMPSGVWDIFLPGVKPGDAYKFEIHGPWGELLPLKADPYATRMQYRPNTASIVTGPSAFQWNDQTWMMERAGRNDRHAPMSIYEVHLGSWRRKPEHDNAYLTYRDFADQLVPYVAWMGFTHIEVLPVSEYPFDGSWGYQPVGLFAPTSRFGTPEDFRYLVDCCHQAGIALWIDWVPGHFPSDPHGLAQFDGTHLYDHADPRQGFHKDWNTLIFNYGRREVYNYLISNALSWLENFHLDGLRVDAVASMLYLDYSRNPGEWIPNQYGGRENLEAVQFLRRMNELVFEHAHGATTAAEESTAWPMVSAPTYAGGLGFGFKWNMGWMHDTLRYMEQDPINRKYHHSDMTFGLLYGFSENYILPLSHDEVTHGKGSILARMPGDDWQRFANLRAYYAFMWTHPGKKLLFMGCEFGQEREWNHDISLDWHLLDDPKHRGVQTLIRDLNHLYRSERSLHELDCMQEGFAWIESNDADQSCLSYMRKGSDAQALAIIVCNFTPVPRWNYRLGVPLPGRYAERINSDATVYGGSGMGNQGGVYADTIPAHGQDYSLNLTLPPLSAVIFTFAE